MDWRDPFLVFGADALRPEDLAQASDAYIRALSRFATPMSGTRPHGSGAGSREDSRAA
jgi:hypothetical protein